MKSTTVRRVAIVAFALGLVLTGCDSKAPDSKSSSTAPPAAGPTAPGAPGNGSAPPTTTPPPSGTNRTIASYIKQNSITETRLKPGAPGVPGVALPIPEGWALATGGLPDYAYSAVIFTGPGGEEYHPNITAVYSKLTGAVDGVVETNNILKLAPGELNNLPGYTPIGEGAESKLGDLPAYQLRGTWNSNGRIKYVAQKTVVIPAPEGLYVLQLNADGLESQTGILNPAMDVVEKDTKLTEPPA